MRNLTRRRSRVPDLRLGSRPAAPGPLSLSLARVPEPERLRVFQEFFERLRVNYDVKPFHDVPFVADLTLRPLPGLQVLAGTMQCSGKRGALQTRADGDDSVALVVNLGGANVISQGRREIELGDGDATLLSLTEPGSFAHRPPGRRLALCCARARLAPLVAGMEDRYLRRIPRDTRALQLLTHYVGVARDEQVMAGGELPHLIATHVRDLMAVAIGATSDAAEVAQGRGLQAARLRAIKQDIAKNPGRTDLSVAALAARHRCTPRFIQRLFETEGTTLTDYVLAQRLALAHRILTDPRRDGDKISTIAYDCGFGDVSYFNRVFRRRYGMAPSDARTQSRQGGPVILM